VDLKGAFPFKILLIVLPEAAEEEEEPSLSSKLNCLFLNKEISLSGKFIDTRNFDFSNFCCFERLSVPFMELGCRGDCFRMLFGRSFADFVRNFIMSIDRVIFIVSPFSSPKLAVFSASGTAGAIENRAALKVAIRIGFSDFRSPNSPFG
jgi:hypothetical protein